MYSGEADQVLGLSPGAPGPLGRGGLSPVTGPGCHQAGIYWPSLPGHET